MEKRRPSLVWSATPTPFTETFQIDRESIRRMVDHHVALGVDGIFVAGTCGEGPWLDERQTEELVRSVSEANGGRLQLGVQVTDNSPARVLERLEKLEKISYDIAVIAQPGVFINGTPKRVAGYYTEILDRTSKPVCFYDRGARAEFPLEAGLLAEICGHPMVRMVKDSTRCEEKRDVYLRIREERGGGLDLLSGDEFCCREYLAAGYDGLMTGGGILTGKLLRRMLELFRQGDEAALVELDDRGRRLLKAVYGGEGFPCWMSGLKRCLVEMGVFSSASSLLGYPLSEGCLAEIRRVVREEAEWLLPDEKPTAAAV